MVCLEESLFHHVKDSAWSAYNDMDSLLENSDFISDDSSTDASVNFNSDELANLLDDVGDLLGKLSCGCHD